MVIFFSRMMELCWMAPSKMMLFVQISVFFWVSLIIYDPARSL